MKASKIARFLGFPLENSILTALKEVKLIAETTVVCDAKSATFKSVWRFYNNFIYYLEIFINCI